MNKKIEGILLKLIVDLKKMGWAPAPDWEITLKSEGYASIIKSIKVAGELGTNKWKDVIETYVNLKLTSDDEITYFPECVIYATISVRGGINKDIAYKTNVSAAFTENDLSNTSKINSSANKIDRFIEDYMNEQYSIYLDEQEQNIKLHTQNLDDRNDED
jgi:hypothetical protein